MNDNTMYKLKAVHAVQRIVELLKDAQEDETGGNKETLMMIVMYSSLLTLVIMPWLESLGVTIPITNN